MPRTALRGINVQVGQKVKYVDENEYPDMLNKICIVKSIDGDMLNVDTIDGKKKDVGYYAWHFEIVSSAKPTLKTITHVVLWKATDCHEFFESEIKAKNFIKELAEKSNVNKNSIYLLEVKSVKKVAIRKSLTMTTHKLEVY